MNFFDFMFFVFFLFSIISTIYLVLFLSKMDNFVNDLKNRYNVNVTSVINLNIKFANFVTNRYLYEKKIPFFREYKSYLKFGITLTPKDNSIYIKDNLISFDFSKENKNNIFLSVSIYIAYKGLLIFPLFCIISIYLKEFLGV